MKTNVLLTTIFLWGASLFSQNIHIQENFNSGSLPNGWTNNALAGTVPWQFGLTGANGVANSNIDGTSFAYFDDDLQGNGSSNTVELISPSFDNSTFQTTILEFDYNFREFNSVSDEFSVEVFDGTNWVQVYNITTDDCGRYGIGPCANGYPHANIDISSYKNTSCKVKFKYFDGNDWAWNVGIDNILISSPYSTDIGVTEILFPFSSSCGIDSSEVQLVVNNYGSQLISNYDVSLLSSGTLLLTESITSSLNPLSSDTITLNQKIALASGSSNQIVAYSVLTNDQNVSNDSATKTVNIGSTVLLPYSTSFETNDPNWTFGGINSSWQRGVPNGTQINTTPSGVNILATNLTGNYNNNETSYVYSPCFDISSDTSAINLSFDINYALEDSYDFLTVEYSIDNGSTWNIVNVSSGLNNWYNHPQGFTENSFGWVNAYLSIYELANENQVKFRFVLNTDATGMREGIGIDNFNVNFKKQFDLALSNLKFSNAISGCFGRNSGLTFELQNRGYQPAAFNTNLTYQLNNNQVYTDTLSIYISNEETVTYGSKNLFSLNNGNNTISAWVYTPVDSIYTNDSLLNYAIDYTLDNSLDYKNFPFTDDFDHYPNNQFNNQPVDSILNGWKQVYNSPFNWKPISDPTNSSFTGPSNDVTGENYIYTEASVGSPGDKLELYSPCIISPDTELIDMSFYYHRYGVDMGDMIIEFYNGNEWVTVDTLIGQQQNSSNDPWRKSKYKLNIRKNNVIRAKFTSIRGSGVQGDMAIDLFALDDSAEVDVQSVIVNLIESACNLGSAESVGMIVRNHGTKTILPGQLQLSYQTLGQSATETILDSIPVDSTLEYVFNTKVNLSNFGTNYDIKAFATLSGDQHPSNDTVSAVVSNLTVVLPYFEDFESVNTKCHVGNFNLISNKVAPKYWVIDQGQSTVQDASKCNFGASNGATSSDLTGPAMASSGTKFYYFEGWSANTIAEIPCIDLTSESAAEVSFDYYHYGADITGLEIRVVDSSGITHSIDSIIGQTHNSNSLPWMIKTIDLSAFVGQQIGIEFKLMNTGNRDLANDIAIDNVSIYNPLATIISELSSEESSFNLYPNPNKGIFYLEIGDNSVGSRFQIFDIRGAIVFEKRISDIKEQVDLTSLEKGMYFIKIEGSSLIKKIIVN